MRILFLIDTLGSGGQERQLIELLKGLDQHEDVAYCLCIWSKNIHYDDAASLKGMIRIIERKPGFDASLFRRLMSLCREFKPDIIQSWDMMSAVYAMPVAKLTGAKFCNAIRNAPEKLSVKDKVWTRVKLTFPFSDRIIANSLAGLRGYRVSARKGVCIHNGFDLKRVARILPEEEVRRKFGIRTPKVVGMVAKFHARKENEVFITAAIDLCRKRNDVTFLAVGDGVKLERCKAMVNPEMGDRILFPGKITGVESLVALFDVGVLAATREGISNAIMEYMVMRKPVVATEGGGTPELVVDGFTGFLIPSGRADVLGERIQHLLDHPEEARRLGEAGRARLETEFSLDGMTQRYVDTYRSCLA
jgi:glycosyltransferase involved in cell wall biosynthesis